VNQPIPGLHHVTAIAGDPQQNLAFYAGILGMRFVKRTVNFDDPGTYHLYYGNGDASPGSIMTFFPWPGAPRGRAGVGQTSATAFSVPAASMRYWADRLHGATVANDGPKPRFDDHVISFTDPDGLRLEIVGSAAPDPRAPWEGGSVPAEHGIRGFHGATLSEESVEGTARLLTETLGFRRVSESGNRFRYAATDAAPGAIVDLLHEPRSPRGVVAVGSIHHVAFRAPGGDDQERWRASVAARGIHVTPIVDRCYFRSIYFREPGGVLLEVATDAPGFAVDEPMERLGESLRLPPWLEPRRTEIEASLPTLEVSS
jgi:glyoxalase family protein